MLDTSEYGKQHEQVRVPRPHPGQTSDTLKDEQALGQISAPPGSPPPYEPSDGEPSARASTFQTARANFVQTITPFENIDATWTLDLSLSPLPNLNPSRSTPGEFVTHDGSRPNLFLFSKYRPVRASIRVEDSTGAAPATRPKQAFIVAQSLSGNVTVEIKSRAPSTKLHICAESMYGNVILRLPRDFNGPVKCRSDRLRYNPMLVRFPPRLKENITVLTMEDSDVYAYIGNTIQPQTRTSIVEDSSEVNALSAQNESSTTSAHPGAVASGNIPTWEGDQVEVIAHNGRIKICYALLEGEEKETEGELRTFVRQTREQGPLMALAKMAFRGVNKAIHRSKKRSEEN